MPRALAVARVTVPPADEAAYLEAASRLAEELAKRGQHLWIFRHPTDAGSFLEFREAGDAARHAAHAPTPEEARLTRALRALGAAAPGADDLWLEVSLAEGPPPADGSA